jgi:hypothetical protein
MENGEGEWRGRMEKGEWRTGRQNGEWIVESGEDPCPSGTTRGPCRATCPSGTAPRPLAF